mmetsp:Transcript_72422/g.198420  ORF Transcript_72422/g.198420 Transcript_72422/m.198420 type:complete len:222 (+) Transcript_72422:398-1063(+)
MCGPTGRQNHNRGTFRSASTRDTQGASELGLCARRRNEPAKRTARPPAAQLDGLGPNAIIEKCESGKGAMYAFLTCSTAAGRNASCDEMSTPQSIGPLLLPSSSYNRPPTVTSDTKWKSKSAFAAGASVCPWDANPECKSLTAGANSLARSEALALAVSELNPSRKPLALLIRLRLFMTVCISATAPHALPTCCFMNHTFGTCTPLWLPSVRFRASHWLNG